MSGLFTLESFCQKSAERKSPKKYFFSYFVLMPGLEYEPELYLDYSEFIRGSGPTINSPSESEPNLARVFAVLLPSIPL